MRRFWLIALLFLVVACGEAPSPSSSATPADPEQPVSVPATTESPVPAASPSPVAVVGKTMRTHKVPWESATPSADGKSIDLVWWSGVAPCNVLDRIDVKEAAGKVTITLYEGHDSREPDAICIEMAIEKTTTVELSESVGDREVVDGAK
jgi:hypothetical protein